MKSPARAGSSTSEKMAHLAELRASVTHLQDQVNTLLTQRMDEEKRAGQGGGASKGDQQKAAGNEDIGDDGDGEDELQ